MGREQGDFLESPVIYVKEIDGDIVERPAYVPADHVNFQAAGWVEKAEAAPVKQASSPTTGSGTVRPAAENNGGSGSGA